ncbi:MAG: hypothetical protein KGI92_01510 [Alphaproteobacteria bacterium]|nr:hypothetical protein [Alphaproteobacteria bacterium]MDE1967557.1 hypothetical protein [Alphaproteobacteria bacterium]
MGRLEQAAGRLEQAVIRLESAVASVSGRAPARADTSAGKPPADVAARIDAVIGRLDRVLEG